MMSAGIPMVQAFEIIGNGHEKPAMQKLVLDIKSNIEGGSTLHESLAKYPLYFDDLFVNLVEAGEQAGALETLLDKIATYKEKTEALKKKIKKALFYPDRRACRRRHRIRHLADFRDSAVRIAVQGIRRGSAGLHADGRQLVAVRAASGLVVAIVVGGGILRILLFPEALEKDALAAWTGSCSSFPSSDRSWSSRRSRASRERCRRCSPPACRWSRPCSPWPAPPATSSTKKRTLRMKDEVATGQRLQRAMENTGLFPNMVVQMIAVGEESGSLDTMSGKVAEFYEAEVDNAVDSMSSLLEPMIMAILGVLVGGMVIAMYLPIFKLGQRRSKPITGRTARAGLAHAERYRRALLRQTPRCSRGRCSCSASSSAAFSTSSFTGCPSCWSASGARRRPSCYAVRRTAAAAAGPPPAPDALHPEHPPLRLPGLQGADHGLAEHPGGQLAGAARTLRGLQDHDLGALSRWWNSPPALLSAWVAWHFGFGAPAACALAGDLGLIALTGIDIDHQLLPDNITLPLMWAGLLAAVVDRPDRRAAPAGVAARCHHRRGGGLFEPVAGVPRLSPGHRQGRHGLRRFQAVRRPGRLAGLEAAAAGHSACPPPPARCSGS